MKTIMNKIYNFILDLSKIFTVLLHIILSGIIPDYLYNINILDFGFAVLLTLAIFISGTISIPYIWYHIERFRK